MIEGLRTCQGEQAQDRVPAQWANGRKPAFIRMLQAGNDLKYTAFSCRVIEGKEESKNRSSCGYISKVISIFFLALLLFLSLPKNRKKKEKKENN